jgi:HEAT repeat protein
VKTRLEAVDSLGKDGGEESVKPLLDATADLDPRVRAKAIDYLGMIGDKHASPLLTQYLFLNDVDTDSKRRILVALGRIKDPQTVDELQLFVQKTDDEVLQCAALHALGEVGDPSSKDFVARYAASEEHNQVQRVADDALAKIEENAAKRENLQPTIIQLERAFRPKSER